MIARHGRDSNWSRIIRRHQQPLGLPVPSHTYPTSKKPTADCKPLASGVPRRAQGKVCTGTRHIPEPFKYSDTEEYTGDCCGERLLCPPPALRTGQGHLQGFATGQPAESARVFCFPCCHGGNEGERDGEIGVLDGFSRTKHRSIHDDDQGLCGLLGIPVEGRLRPHGPASNRPESAVSITRA